MQEPQEVFRDHILPSQPELQSDFPSQAKDALIKMVLQRGESTPFDQLLKFYFQPAVAAILAADSEEYTSRSITVNDLFMTCDEEWSPLFNAEIELGGEEETVGDRLKKTFLDAAYSENQLLLFLAQQARVVAGKMRENLSLFRQAGNMAH